MDLEEKKTYENNSHEEFNLPEFPVSFSIFAFARSHRALAGQFLRSIGLFPGQEIILMQLWQKDGQSQNCLGKTLRMDHSTVAKSVKRLEEAGLVTRSRSQEDKRVTIVSLTESGHELEAKVLDAWCKLETITTDGLTEEEKAVFIKLSLKMAVKVDSFLNNR